MPGRTKAPAVAIYSSQHALRVPRRKLGDLIAFVARAEGARIDEVDVAVVGAAKMAALNRRYLRRAGPTDVLSFDLSRDEDAALSAEIVVCGDLAVREAAKRRWGRQRELMLYVVHGLLHLLGYDDDTAASAERMHAREEELLEAFAARSRRRTASAQRRAAQPATRRPSPGER